MGTAFLNLIKNIREKHTANIILNGEPGDAVLLRSEIRQEDTLSPLLHLTGKS